MRRGIRGRGRGARLLPVQGNGTTPSRMFLPHNLSATPFLATRPCVQARRGVGRRSCPRPRVDSEGRAARSGEGANAARWAARVDSCPPGKRRTLNEERGGGRREGAREGGAGKRVEDASPKCAGCRGDTPDISRQGQGRPDQGGDLFYVFSSSPGRLVISRLLIIELFGDTPPLAGDRRGPPHPIASASARTHGFTLTYAYVPYTKTKNPCS